jgi:hypothetical protein
LPSGPIAVTIPTVTETFQAAPFDGNLDYGGTSGKEFAPVASGSATQTTVMTSPAQLAALTGNFRIPVSVDGHAMGSATSSNGDVSAGFNTQTSATITIIYHYIPNLPSLDPPIGTPPGGQSTGGSGSAATSGSPSSSTGNEGYSAPQAPTATASLVHAASFQAHTSTHAGKKKPMHAVISAHRSAHHSPGGHVRPRSVALSRGVKRH